MASITEVAERAGVSVATVSRLINGSDNIAKPTVDRIRKAMLELGYVPRAVRPGPRPKVRTGVKNGSVMFLALYPFSPTEMFSMPAFPALIGGIQNTLMDAGLNLIFAHSPKGQNVPPALAAGKVDGVLLMGNVMRFSRQLAGKLKDAPTVWVFREHNDPDCEFDHVLYDNSVVGVIAARHLRAQGHEYVGFVSPDTAHTAYIERRAAFAEECRKLVMKVEFYEPKKAPAGSNEMLIATDLAGRLAGGSKRPTGLFVVSDTFMLPFFGALERNGIRPMEDIELIGCNNDITRLNQMHPRPATIDIRLNEVGRKSVEQLRWRMQHPHDGTLEIKIKPMLIGNKEVESESDDNPASE